MAEAIAKGTVCSLIARATGCSRRRDPESRTEAGETPAAVDQDTERRNQEHDEPFDAVLEGFVVVEKRNHHEVELAEQKLGRDDHGHHTHHRSQQPAFVAADQRAQTDHDHHLHDNKAGEKCVHGEPSVYLHRAVTTTGAPGTAGRQPEARQIIELLLEHGADPSIENNNGKKPADYVTDEEILALLTGPK